MKILSLLIATAHSISASEEADCPSVANTANKAMIRIIYSDFQCVSYKIYINNAIIALLIMKCLTFSGF